MVCKAMYLPRGEISLLQVLGNMIKSGRKFKDDDVGERLGFAKRKLLVTLLNYHGVLQAYCRDSNMGAIRKCHACSWGKRKSQRWNKIIVI